MPMQLGVIEQPAAPAALMPSAATPTSDDDDQARSFAPAQARKRLRQLEQDCQLARILDEHAKRMWPRVGQFAQESLADLRQRAVG